MAKLTIITGKKPDAPTIALPKIVPNKIIIILSSGVLIPNDLLPEILIKISAKKKTTIPRQVICKEFRSFPCPKSSCIKCIIL